MLLAICLLLPVMSQAAEPGNLIANLEAGRTQVVVAYGTSLTQGGAWVKQVETALGKKYPGMATVINSGGSGQWSEWGVKNLEKRVIEKKPASLGKVVFLHLVSLTSMQRFRTQR